MLRVKELRKAHQPPLSVEKLAQRADLTAKTVQRIERLGRGNSESLKAIADALGVDIGELFEEESA